MFLASNAFQAGSLAASQPGLTIVDPLVASMLGVLLFGERLNHHPVVLTGEIVAVAVLVASVVILSRSPLVQDESRVASAPMPLPDGEDTERAGELAASEGLGDAVEFVSMLGMGDLGEEMGALANGAPDQLGHPEFRDDDARVMSWRRHDGAFR